jgi:putative nucleotidyltransferase with HDIG domain
MPIVVVMRREVEASIKALQPLPRAVMRLVELLESETATLGEVETLLKAEPVLCGRVLQIVNSAYYGLPRAVSTLQQALMLLGVHAVRGIVLGVAAASTLRGSRVVSSVERELWRHSVTVAGYAQRIARACRWGHRVSEDTYIVGLLHDIGALFLAARFSGVYHSLLQATEEPIAAERELFGYDHADIGAMIAEHWKLPERIVRVIGEHHAPCLPEGDIRLLTRRSCKPNRGTLRSAARPVSTSATRALELSELISIDEAAAAEMAPAGRRVSRRLVRPATKLTPRLLCTQGA